MKNFDVEKFTKNAFYPEGESLIQHVSPETYQRIKRESLGLGIPAEMIDTEKPWFLAMTLEVFKLIKYGFDPDLGIDKHFLSKAEGKKRILELESLDEQLNLLSGLSDEEQESFLMSTLKDLDMLEQNLDQLLQSWTSGDTKGMEGLMTQGMSEDRRLSSVYEKIINNRNKNMVLKIEDFLKTKETYFVIVGAGHLVGRQGIVEILKEKGYSIEQW